MKRKPTNPITKVRTGTGDTGLTYLTIADVSKASESVDFVGELDEAMASLALVDVQRMAVTCETVDIQIGMKELLFLSMEVLFQIGAMVHNSNLIETNGDFLDEYVDKTTSFIARVTESDNAVELFQPLEGFIVPNVRNVNEMMSRAIVRRAERGAVRSDNLWAVPALNTMSDLLFMVAWHNSPPFDQWVGVN